MPNRSTASLLSSRVTSTRSLARSPSALGQIGSDELIAKARRQLVTTLHASPSPSSQVIGSLGPDGLRRAPYGDRKEMPRAGFAYVDGVLPNEQYFHCPTALRRLRQRVGFAIYRASHDDYEDSYLPTGSMAAPPKTPSTRLRPLPRRPHRLELKPPTKLRP